VVHQDLAHYGCGDAEEMGAVSPIRIGSLDHPQVGFMDQGRRLECVARHLMTEKARRNASQFPINQGHYLVESGLISRTAST
jgi:hypothetical protein